MALTQETREKTTGEWLAQAGNEIEIELFRNDSRSDSDSIPISDQDNDEFSGGVGWSEAKAHAVRWNDWLGFDFIPIKKHS